MVQVSGLGSWLDVSGLVSQLMTAERAGPELQLTRETSKLNARLSAFGSLKGAIAGLQTALGGLNTAANFDRKTVTSSNTAALTATTASSAVTNSYAIEVSQLAAAHSLASPAFADSTTPIGNGTLTFRFGTTAYDADTDAYTDFTLNPDSKITTLTIDSSNNTLSGVMNAINAAKFGVKASIVNDGTGDRLLLASERTGLQNSLEITVGDADGNDIDTGAAAGLSNFAFSQAATSLTQTRAAANAIFKVNGLTVQSQENTATTAIPGVSLMLKETTTAPVTLSVQADTTAVVGAFNSFVTSYNQFRNTVSTLTGYNAQTGAAGTLLGDFTVRAVVAQVENILRNDVAGVPGELNNLAELGLKTNSNGTYALDVDAFKAALQADPEGVAKLFTALGTADTADISYQAATTATEAGNYAVNITTAATAGRFAGAGVLPNFGGGGTLAIDADNDTLSLSVDGIATGSITLTHGTYTTGASLASEIQARINGTATLSAAGRSVTVSYDADNARLVISSTTFGNSSQVNLVAVDTASAATLGLSVATGTAGTDVAGTINGAAAQGAGKLLTAATGTGAAGLGLMVSGTATGDRGSVNFTRGVTDQLKLLLSKVLASEGSLAQRIDSIGERQDAVQTKRQHLELKWKTVEARYLAQFNALDTLLAQLQSTSSYLESQLSALPKAISSRRNR